MKEPDSLQQALGVRFKDPALLRHALVHSSFVNENPDLAPAPNERLEFLGDAVLDLVVAARLYLDYTQLNEGEMTKLRATLVRRDTLARAAKSIGLGEHLYLGKGEDTSGGRSKPANLAGALEAVIGAIYLDQGFEAARKFIWGLLDAELSRAINERSDANYKSELQELLQAHKQQTPVYHVVKITGPDHDRTFTVEVRLGDTVLGHGSGKSKKAAETAAAQAILPGLKDDFTR